MIFTIKGTIRKVIFRSNDGYTVGLFKVKETKENELSNKTITITGYFSDTSLTESYELKGKIVFNNKYGEQFQVDNYKMAQPETTDELIFFLSSDNFKGVGLKTAKKIVDCLKEETISLLKKDYKLLDKIPDLTLNQKEKIIQNIENLNNDNKIIQYLVTLGFSSKESLKIYDKFKTESIEMINNNIYDLAEKTDIPFLKIEKIIIENKLSINIELRMYHLILYVIKYHFFQSGDMYIEMNDLIRLISKEQLSTEQFENIMDKLIKDKRIVLISDKNIYLYEMYEEEYYIAKRLYDLNEYEPENYEYDIDVDYYNEEQRKAIKMALNSRFTIITGGPGTGKTTIIKKIIELYEKYNSIEEIKLLAPTGRAAKKMTEATDITASTIHRFLKWNKETNDFLVNEKNKAKEMLYIVDEASMLDTHLFSSLLKGINNRAKVILVGDENQLPSVSPGQVLKDLIESDYFNVTKLKKIYRQSEQSYLYQLAHEIKENNLESLKMHTEDFKFIETDNIVKKTSEIVKEELIKNKEVQVLAPIYAGKSGIDSLNSNLQPIFNQQEGASVNYKEIIYKVGDKVIQLVNSLENNVFNGDIGAIISIESLKGIKYLVIDFDGNIIKYSIKELHQISHAFAISIHKSQGSEFETVIMPMSFEYRSMLYKKIVYTGITRAKNTLYIIGNKEAFMRAIKNDYSVIRKSGIKTLLNRFYGGNYDFSQ
jgi:exodeoxyribonuclease V alpha subunit